MADEKTSKGTILIEASALGILASPRLHASLESERFAPRIKHFLGILEILAANGYKVVITQETSLKISGILGGMSRDGNLGEAPVSPEYIKPETYALLRQWMERIHEGESNIILADENGLAQKANRYDSSREVLSDLLTPKDRGNKNSIITYINNHPDESCTVVTDSRGYREDLTKLADEVPVKGLLSARSMLAALESKGVLQELGITQKIPSADELRLSAFRQGYAPSSTAVDCTPHEMRNQTYSNSTASHPFLHSLDGVKEAIAQSPAQVVSDVAASEGHGPLARFRRNK